MRCTAESKRRHCNGHILMSFTWMGFILAAKKDDWAILHKNMCRYKRVSLSVSLGKGFTIKETQSKY